MVPLGSVRKAGCWVSLIWVWMEAWAFWWPGGLEMCPGEQGELTSQFCLMRQIFWGRWRPGPLTQRHQPRALCLLGGCRSGNGQVDPATLLSAGLFLLLRPCLSPPGMK